MVISGKKKKCKEELEAIQSLGSLMAWCNLSNINKKTESKNKPHGTFK